MRQVYALVASACMAAMTGCATSGGGMAATAAPLAVKEYPQYNVYETYLKNGLKVLVKEDHRAPVMVSQVWYKVGSTYEENGTTGLSHVLEHMMFKGTEKYGPNEFSRIVAANGGRENAFTGQDYTGYYQQMEKSRLPVSFELEADRMHNLKLLDQEFKKEVQVVMEERRMRTDDDPQSLTYEQFTATAYVNSPYHAPVIGWMDDLRNMSVEDLAAWYRTWYAPNNATVVVVGDVDHKEVFALAEKFYGPIPAGTIPKLKPRREVPQKGERRIIVKAPAKVPYVVLGYKVPSIDHSSEDWEPYALEVASTILDGGGSARFSKRLVRGSEIAAGVGTNYNAYTPGQELFVVSGTPNQGKTIAELEKGLRAEIVRLKEEPVTADELNRVKAQVLSSKVYEKDSIMAQAMAIGMLETTGYNWQLGEQLLDRIKAVTPEQIQAVAKKYFVDEGLTVAVLDPQPTDKSPAAAPHMQGVTR